MNTTRKLLQPSQKAGFTLVELLVTTAITSIILLTASVILMTFFLSNTRTNIRRQLKSEGARASARIEFVARGAQSCSDTAGNTDITFTNLDNSTVRIWFAENFDWGGGVIVDTIRMTTTPSGGTGTTEELLSQFAQVQNVLFDCVRETVDGQPANKLYANIRFELANPGTTANIMESFSTLAVLRNSE
ncbi:MAG: hypothetical protein QG639_1055 [Patescibacteria group bacterium]|jgi:prepilin-type N-terminal cleavage/methylation domain-containing protein|nr:hypothetical protein [Patescibacteria group bacterium]